MRKTLDVQKLKRVATNIRRHIVVMSGNANVSHSGSALSTVEILTALYFKILKIKDKERIEDFHNTSGEGLCTWR